jgi:hypothetical protein
VKILGQDDWLFYARRDDGTLVYTVIDMDEHWWDAPHRGDCWYPESGRNCDGETAFVCRRDCAFMLAHVTQNTDNYEWLECGRDTDGSRLDWPESEDAAFMASSRSRYLPVD